MLLSDDFRSLVNRRLEEHGISREALAAQLGVPCHVVVQCLSGHIILGTHLMQQLRDAVDELASPVEAGLSSAR